MHLSWSMQCNAMPYFDVSNAWPNQSGELEREGACFWLTKRVVFCFFLMWSTESIFWIHEKMVLFMYSLIFGTHPLTAVHETVREFGTVVIRITFDHALAGWLLLVVSSTLRVHHTSLIIVSQHKTSKSEANSFHSYHRISYIIEKEDRYKERK